MHARLFVCRFVWFYWSHSTNLIWYLTLFWLFLQFLVVEHIHVPGFPDHFHNHFGPVRRELRKHLWLPNDPLPGPNQHPAGCLRLSPPARFSCHFELLHQPQLPIHSVPGEVTVPQCTRVPASRRRHGGQLRECQSRVQQAQLEDIDPAYRRFRVVSAGCRILVKKRRVFWFSASLISCWFFVQLLFSTLMVTRFVRVGAQVVCIFGLG